MTPFWLPLLYIAATSPIDWARKEVPLDKLEQTYGFKDISQALLAESSWAAKVSAQVTWLPPFADGPGRRAVQFQGHDSKGELVYSIVAARTMKTDQDYNIAQYIEHQGYFAMPSQDKDPNVYRHFWLYAHPTPFDNRPGRWAVMLEVRGRTPWHSDGFVEAVFRAYGEKAPRLPSEEPVGLFMPSLSKWMQYSTEYGKVSVFQADDMTTVWGVLERMKPSIVRVGGVEEKRLSVSFVQHEVWALPDGTQIIYYFRGKPQGWPDMSRLHVPYNSQHPSLTVWWPVKAKK